MLFRSNNAWQAPLQQKLSTDKQATASDDIQQEHIGSGIGRGEGQGRGQGSGQGHGCQMPTVDDHLKILNEKLSLSREQLAMAEWLLAKQLDLLDSVRKNKSLSSDDGISKARSVRHESTTQLLGLLNEDQKARFDEMLRDKTDIMKQRRENGEDCALIWIVME